MPRDLKNGSTIASLSLDAFGFVEPSHCSQVVLPARGRRDDSRETKPEIHVIQGTARRLSFAPFPPHERTGINIEMERPAAPSHCAAILIGRRQYTPRHPGGWFGAALIAALVTGS